MKTDEGRRNTAVVLSLVFILFSIYGLTTPKTVTLEDDGLFIMASLDGGVAHPRATRSSLFWDTFFLFFPWNPRHSGFTC